MALTPGKPLQRQLQRLWGVTTPEAVQGVLDDLATWTAANAVPDTLRRPLASLPQEPPRRARRTPS